MTKSQIQAIGLADKQWLSVSSFSRIITIGGNTFITDYKTNQFYFDLDNGIMLVRYTKIPYRVTETNIIISILDPNNQAVDAELLGGYYTSTNVPAAGYFHTIVDIDAIKAFHK